MADAAFPVPDSLPEILKDFVREILSDQDKRRWTQQEIFEFGASYFSGKAQSGKRSEKKEAASDEEIMEMLTQLFLKGDKDGNGVLDKKEFKKLLQGCELGLSASDIKVLYTQADVNDDGCVEYREFIPACVDLIRVLRAQEAARESKEQQRADALMQADYFLRGMSSKEIESMMSSEFQLADKDGNGSLDEKEFMSFLKSMPLNLTKREINAAMIAADANGDGKIEYEEFVGIFHAVMLDMVALDILKVSAEPNYVSNLLVQCCAAYDPQRSGFLPINKVSRAFRDADLGLTKFQIACIVRIAEQGAHGVDYSNFILQSASPAILKLLEVDETLQYQRAKAWRQVTETEEMSKVLGLTRDQFTMIVGETFQAADHDKSGSLDPQEFEECIRSISLNFSEDDIKLLLAAADVNQDGQIQYGEFTAVAFYLIQETLQQAEIEAKMAAFLEELADV